MHLLGETVLCGQQANNFPPHCVLPMLGKWSITDCNGWVVGLMLLWCERKCGLDLRCTGGEKQSKAKHWEILVMVMKSDAFGEVRLDSASVWVLGTESGLPLALCVGFLRSSPGR